MRAVEVAPLAGARIEIDNWAGITEAPYVAPLAGARIEIFFNVDIDSDWLRRPSRRGEN